MQVFDLGWKGSSVGSLALNPRFMLMGIQDDFFVRVNKDCKGRYSGGGGIEKSILAGINAPAAFSLIIAGEYKTQVCGSLQICAEVKDEYSTPKFKIRLSPKLNISSYGRFQIKDKIMGNLSYSGGLYISTINADCVEVGQ